MPYRLELKTQHGLPNDLKLLPFAVLRQKKKKRIKKLLSLLGKGMWYFWRSAQGLFLLAPFIKSLYSVMYHLIEREGTCLPTTQESLSRRQFCAFLHLISHTTLLSYSSFSKQSQTISGPSDLQLCCGSLQTGRVTALRQEGRKEEHSLCMFHRNILPINFYLSLKFNS